MTRAVRCPSCHANFETARRFQMACASCGYEWEEESHRTTGDKVGDVVAELPQRVGFAIIWAGLLVFLCAVFGWIGYLLLGAAQRNAANAAFAVLFLVVAGGLMFGTVWTRSGNRRGPWAWFNERWFWRR
jgi:hypothetical protein